MPGWASMSLPMRRFGRPSGRPTPSPTSVTWKTGSRQRSSRDGRPGTVTPPLPSRWASPRWSQTRGARTIAVPVLAKLGAFRTPRLLHDTATRLAPWTNGFVLVHSISRRVLDDKGTPAFEGTGRERADVVGAQTFTVASRQVEEMLAWRKAGAWDRAILAVGGICTVERAQDVLREGADAALVATAARFDPLFAVRFRQTRPAEVA